MVKISGNTVHLDTPSKEMRIFVRDHVASVVGVTVDKLNRVYISVEVKRLA